MKKPLLSVCIATYNRADCIGETLDSIISQLEDEVELMVVDGASTDNTETIVSRYVNADARVRYVRLSAKGGVDQDYCKAVALADGEFCWLFTDDDLMKPGAVKAVKAAINDGHGLIIVNAEVLDQRLVKLLEPQRITIQHDKIYSANEMDCFVVDAMRYLSFIGAVVIRRNTWLNRNQEAYFGTEFVHVGVIFQNTLRETTLIISQPYISIRYGNAQWAPRHFDIWMFKWPQLVWSFSAISDQVKSCIARKEPWRRLSTLLLERGKGFYTADHYHRILAKKPAGVLWKICAWFIAQIPVKVLAYLLYQYCCRRRPNPLLLFELQAAREYSTLHYSKMKGV